MEKSTHKCEVVEVKLTKHPNADALSIVPIYGYTCVVRSEDWKDGDLGVYIPPDSVVDNITRPEFSWLDKPRVKAKKLRGVVSYGLLIPAPAGAQLGEDWAEKLGVTHYDSEKAVEKGRNNYWGSGAGPAPPGVYNGKYDIDTLRRYKNVFEEGEPVVVREKIYGANSRFVCVDGMMFCGSRTEWKTEFNAKPQVTKEQLLSEGVPEDKIEEILKRIDEKYTKQSRNLWWRVLRENPYIEAFCRNNERHILYGETYGSVQSLRYGAKDGEVFFRAFDIMKPDNTFFDAPLLAETLDSWNIPQPPLIGNLVPFNLEEVYKMAEGPSLIPGANHIREGCVVRPMKERWNEKIGRVQLKVVGGGYLSLTDKDAEGELEWMKALDNN